MQSRTQLLFVALIVIAAPRFAAAQGSSTADSTRSVVLRNAIDGNWHLRLSGPQDTVDGRVLAVEGDNVRLVAAQFRVRSIERIDRMQRHGGGAVVGGLIGGLGLGFLGYGLSGLCEDNCDWIWAKAYLMGALVGGVTGAILGNIVAPPRRSWDPIWP
jgi:hypothetical protein